MRATSYSPSPWRATVILAALTLVHCDILSKLTQPNGLTIQRFTATPGDITAGTVALLSWDVEGAETVQIDNGIGTVSPKGARQIQPSWTTTYTLAAKVGTSAATASVQVIVRGSSGPSPTPSPSPAPTPTPTPTPTPSPTPSPSPSPSPTPPAPACGTPATSAGTCLLTVIKPAPLPEGQCIDLNAVSVNQACPAGFGTVLSLGFELTAHTTRPSLTWRRAPGGGDVLTPASGAIDGNGASSVLASDIVLDNAVTIEVLSGDQVVLSFSLRHN